jgi:hypothetical protein
VAIVITRPTIKLETKSALDFSIIYSGIWVYSHITLAGFAYKEAISNSDDEQKFDGIIEEEPSMVDFMLQFLYSLKKARKL